jgi:hypothetical protein
MEKANFKSIFIKSLELINIMENNDYVFSNRNSDAFSYIDGNFTITISTQISGHLSAYLFYSKKKNNSTDTLKITQYLDLNDFNKSINDCENECLKIANFFN